MGTGRRLKKMTGLIDIMTKTGKGSVRIMIGTVEIEIVIPETETADLRESPRERGISVRPPGTATADIPEDLPGTDMPETVEALSGTRGERTRESDTPEGDKGTALEK